jgi:hypothetical protein
MMKFLRLVVTEIRMALMTFLFFFFLRMLLNELSALLGKQRGSVFNRGFSKRGDRTNNQCADESASRAAGRPA